MNSFFLHQRDESVNDFELKPGVYRMIMLFVRTGADEHKSELMACVVCVKPEKGHKAEVTFYSKDGRMNVPRSLGKTQDVWFVSAPSSVVALV